MEAKQIKAKTDKIIFYETNSYKKRYLMALNLLDSLYWESRRAEVSK